MAGFQMDWSALLPDRYRLERPAFNSGLLAFSSGVIRDAKTIIGLLLARAHVLGAYGGTA